MSTWSSRRNVIALCLGIAAGSIIKAVLFTFALAQQMTEATALQAVAASSIRTVAALMSQSAALPLLPLLISLRVLGWSWRRMTGVLAAGCLAALIASLFAFPWAERHVGMFMPWTSGPFTHPEDLSTWTGVESATAVLRGTHPDGSAIEPLARRRAAMHLGQAASLLITWGVMTFVVLKRRHWSLATVAAHAGTALVSEKAVTALSRIIEGQAGVVTLTLGLTAVALLPLALVAILLPEGAGSAVPLTASPRGRSAGVFATGLILAAALSLGSIPFRSSPTERTPLIAGAPMPDVALDLIDGGTLRLRDHEDAVVVLTFWATWCRPCLLELEALDRLRDELTAPNVEIIAANAGEDRLDVIRAAAGLGHGIRLASANESVQAAFGVTGFPSTFVLEGGVVRAHQVGYGEGTMAGLRREIENLVAPP